VLWYPPRYPADRHVKSEKQALTKAEKARAKQAKAEAEHVKAQKAKADRAKAAQTTFEKALAAKAKADQRRTAHAVVPLLSSKPPLPWPFCQPLLATSSEGK